MTEEKPTEAFTQAYRSNLARLRKIGQRRRARFNSDWARVKKVVGLMTKNWLEHGYYVCPCKQQNDPPIRGVDVACPCPDLSAELRRDGHCHCRLFYVP